MLNSTEPKIQMISIELIIPNRFQPRLSFDEQGINELAASIKEHGIIQPLVLRNLGDKYEIIAGERRYKASTIAGLTEVPAIITELDDNQSAEVALVENIQRRNLSSIEEAKSYKKILDRGQLTQEQLASKMGISQPTIANKLRLLNLDEDVQEALMNEKISERHARSLLQFSDVDEQKKMLHRIVTERLTVRLLDVEIKKILNPGTEEIEKFDEPAIETLETEVLETLDPEEVQVEDTLNTEQENILEQLVDEVKVDEVEIDTLETDETLQEVKKDPANELIGKAKSTILNIFDQPDKSLEDEVVNMNVDIANTPGFNPFETEEKEETVPAPPSESDLEEPETIIVAPPPEPEKRIIKDDLETVKQAYKELEREALSEKFNISSEEFDFEDLYQIIIKIEKQVE